MRGVIDPELGDNLVDLGMVRGIEIGGPGKDPGAVTVTIALTIAGCPLRSQLQDDTKARVGSLPGVTSVDVQMGEMSGEEKRKVMERARWKARENALGTDIPPTARIAAIASGKGGVGKSSVTANLAAALARRGFTVGVLDADVAGFSIPRMLGLRGRKVEAKARHDDASRPHLYPVERQIGSGMVKVVSMGAIPGAEEDEAVMFRGLMLNRAVQHFLEDVRWGDLDYLLIDMPPGTSDVQMGLARMLPRAEMIVVTTPAQAAQKVATRAADMARRGHLRIVGVIENMAGFVCGHGESYPLFGEGGGGRLAKQVGVPLLGSVPLDAAVALGGDSGEPAALRDTGPAAEAFAAIADKLVAEAMPPVEMAGCTARMLEMVENS
ncbi:MAG: Mrp/NBP35 family ATP-binding protein [Actinobacteria bacterium]|nr:Mrp/NBP35 family ATP-binding protein [Actinomycetota bacterium]